MRVPLILFALHLLLLPVPAAAQKDAFLDSFVEFHSALQGTYGDEGSRVSAALDRMESSLTVWEQSQLISEAELKGRAGITPAELALFYADQGRFDEAIEAAADAIKAEPNRVSLYVFQGLLQEQAGRRTDAAATFARATKQDPTDPIAAYLSASRLPLQTQPEELQRLLVVFRTNAGRLNASASRIPFVQWEPISDFSSKVPVFSPAAYAEGFALFARGKFRNALTQFRTAVAADPLVADPVGRNSQARGGVTSLREKRAEPALASLRALVTMFPNSSEAHRLLGVGFRAVAKLPDSIRHLEMAVRLAPRNERARVTLGSTLAEARRLADAERVLRETIDLMPASADARWALANVYEQMNRGVDAIATLEDAASLTVLAGKHALYWRIAELAHRHQDYDRVVNALSERVRLLPNEGHAHKDLGLAYARIGRSHEALAELLMTMLLGVQDAETLTAVGQIHLVDERFDDAEAVLRRAIALDAKNPQARYALGMTLTRMGRTSEANQELDEFRRLRAAALGEQQRQFQKP